MDSIWNVFYHRIKIVCHTAIISSLIFPATNVYAQNYRCSIADNSIANDMVEKAKKEILRPLNNLKKKSNLCMNDIVRGCVQAKKNADKIHNTEKDTATLFKDMLKFLKKERGVSLSSNQVKKFASMLQKCEREIDSKGNWLFHTNFQAKTHHPRHSEPESDSAEINVNQGLAILEGLCGFLFMILGGYLVTTPWGQQAGKGLTTVGFGLCTDAGIQVFKKDTYENVPKNKGER